ncbi:MAG TPA: hypothetical protein VMO00_16925 [Methylomirabilota bacterium]|nr:hypothetical protein [Methylomirabilota bacterium]
MKCQRCIRTEEATHRVYSDVIEMNVCLACAAEAWSLGLTSKWLRPDELKKDGAENGSSGSHTASIVLVDSSVT